MSYYIQMAKAAKDGGIATYSQLMALGVLNHSVIGVTMGQLAKCIGISTAAMTGIADKFCKSGLAIRVSEPNDRRVFRLKITAKGKKLLNQILP